ncbi:MAG: DNA mismatch repair protein MutS [Kouleothrix sp.]|nr:DNA mismatch repair protein MutS [Kouleothrix sp.]
MSQPSPLAPQEGTTPEEIYRRRCAAYGRQRDIYSRRSGRNGNVSLVLAAAAVILFALWLWRAELAPLLAAGLLGLAFVASFVRHGRVDRELRRYAELYAINDEGLLRLRRDWERLPLRLPPASHATSQRWSAGALERSGALSIERATAADLDLLGRASLQHLLGTPATPVGQAVLLDWILAPAPPQEVRARQAAVAELAPLIDFRDQLALCGRLMGPAQPDYERFLRWAERAPWLPRHAWLLWAARLLPLATLGLAAAQLTGLVAAPLWVVPVAIGALLTQTIGRQVDAVVDEVAERQGVFATYADLFEVLEAQPFRAPALRQLQARLAAGQLRADRQMRRLNRLMALVDLRGWMFFYPIQIATLWSAHVLWLLERWQAQAGGSARRWLVALGELEALCALAALAHDNPRWAFPEIAEGGAPLLSAADLGHPLLPPDACVGNDVAVGPPGQYLLVTGSNMSGKSTLLRAIGVNVTLAQAGGPVCAQTMRLPPVALATSMRVQDSLEQGVSYFMAELRRLKMVVEAAEQAADGRVLLFLLDEILHGTNTAERQIAARRIILHLLGLGAMGAVSTHDLTLAAAPELAARGRPVHFAEQFTRGDAGLEMSFDYRLRPGIATSTNALKLMEMIGLPIDDEGVQPLERSNVSSTGLKGDAL